MYEVAWHDKVSTVEEFCEAVKDALQFWLDVHTIPEVWLDNWLSDYSISELFEWDPNTFKNGYFSFDWYGAACEEYARQYSHEWCQCSGCGGLWERWSFDCDCEKGAEPEDVNEDCLAEYLQDCEYPMPEHILEKVALERGFTEYRRGVSRVTATVEDEITECIAAIEASENNYDLLQATLWATRIYHVNGNLTQDYCENVGLDYGLVDSVRNNGLESIFSREKVLEFIGDEL